MEKKMVPTKSEKRIRTLLIICMTFMATGFTSFSNHPTWGYWWSGFGFVALLVVLGFKYGVIEKKEFPKN